MSKIPISFMVKNIPFKRLTRRARATPAFKGRASRRPGGIAVCVTRVSTGSTANSVSRSSDKRGEESKSQCDGKPPH